MKHLLFFLTFLIAQSSLAEIGITPTARTFSRDGGGAAIIVSGSGAWQASTQAPWITLFTTSGNGAGTVAYLANANTTADTRQGTILIDDKVFTVTQNGYESSISPSFSDFTEAGGTGTVNVTVGPGISWSAVADVNWIQVNSASGISSGQVNFTVSPYEGVQPRFGSITIAGKTFDITQTGGDLALSPSNASVSYEATAIPNIGVEALSSTTWSVQSNVSWISVVDAGRGSGDSAITLGIGENPSYLERVGTVSVGSKTFTVTQEGTPNLRLEINPTEATADASGAVGNVAVLATPDAPWSAESLDPWIIVSQGETGAGNGNISYVVTPNTNLEERIGQIRINPPAPKPKPDLDKGLLYSTYLLETRSDQDESGWGRSLGSENALTGPPLRRQDDGFSMVVDFNVEVLNSIKRLSEVTRPDGSYSTIWVNSSNEVVFRSGSDELKSIPLPAIGSYRAYVTASESSDVKLVLFSDLSADEDPVIISSNSKQFSQPPFPVDIELGDIVLNESNVPSVGQLRDAAITGYKLYDRALTQKEIEKYDTDDEAYVPKEPTPTQHFNFNGSLSGTGEGDPGIVALMFDTAGRSTSTSTVKDRLGLESGALKLDRSTTLLVDDNRSIAAWVKFDSISDQEGVFQNFSSSFSYVGGSYTFEEARSDASARGGRLAVLDTPSKNNEANAVRLAGGGRNTWIGLERDGNGVFRWENGAVLQNPTWDLSNEEAVNQNYAGFWELNAGGMWITYPGNRAYSYMLEMVQDRFAISNGFLTHNDVDLLKVPKSQWLHLAVTVATDDFKQIFINGEEVFSGITELDSFQKFEMSFDGAVDMVSTYEEALTSAQIRSIYESQKPETYFHTITQGAFQPSVEPSQATVSSSGGSASTNLILSGNVQWTATTTTPWLNITSSATGAGSAEIRVVAEKNPTVYERTGTVLVAGQTFSVIQPGLNVDLEYERPIFRADGGDLTIDVNTEAGAAWEVTSDVDWIIPALPQGGQGTGSGSAFVIIRPYTNTTSSRTGTLFIAGQEVIISQRGYDLTVSPNVAEVGSNAGAGEFGVAAPLTAVWEAIVTAPWITLIGGQDGQGNGTVRYSLGNNTTGAPRTGKIIVAGEEYVITQYAGIDVTVTAASNGTTSGTGSYETNAVATLTATADQGYVFSHWTGDAVGSDNPLELIVDSTKNVVANFIPDSAVAQFQQPILAQIQVKDEVIEQKNSQLQANTLTIADLQNGINTFVAANIVLQASYDNAIAERDARFVDSDEDGITDVKETELETDPQEVTAFYLEAADPLAIETARLAGRSEVLNAPQNFNLYTSSQYNSVVIQRDARPTQLAYNAVIAQRDARPTAQELNQAVSDATTSGREQVTSNPSLYNLYTTAQYAAVIAERNARPTQDAYDAVIAQRDARPTFEEVTDARLGSVLLLPNAATNKVKLRFTIEESNGLGFWFSRQEEAE
ncbi:hypothetical protein N9142_02405, partial [Akkermansiaceae bacterium]|nr:hypothetical protein [Akkermansiaceae bacterium]